MKMTCSGTSSSSTFDHLRSSDFLLCASTVWAAPLPFITAHGSAHSVAGSPSHRNIHCSLLTHCLKAHFWCSGPCHVTQVSLIDCPQSLLASCPHQRRGSLVGQTSRFSSPLQSVQADKNFNQGCDVHSPFSYSSYDILYNLYSMHRTSTFEGYCNNVAFMQIYLTIILGTSQKISPPKDLFQFTVAEFSDHQNNNVASYEYCSTYLL